MESKEDDQMLSYKEEVVRKQFRQEAVRLRNLKKEQRACIDSGYIQHYPEYNEFISETLEKCRNLKRSLRLMRVK